MSKTKKTNPIMWTIRNNKNGMFMHKGSRYNYTKSINNAIIFKSRSRARGVKIVGESVYKLCKSKNGGIQIIGPEWI